MKRKLLIVLIISIIASVSYAKRLAPKEVPAIEHNNVRYVVEHWGASNGNFHNGGYIEAQDIKTNEKIWGVTIYRVFYNFFREKDVQDVFITSMKLDKNKEYLIIVNEKGKIYHLDISTRKVKEIKKSD